MALTVYEYERVRDSAWTCATAKLGEYATIETIKVLAGRIEDAITSELSKAEAEMYRAQGKAAAKGPRPRQHVRND